MDVIKFHYGCNIKPEGCSGPLNNFYTVFGSRVENLGWHIIVALIIGLVFGAVLIKLKKHGKLNVPFTVILILQIIATILSFFALAYTIPAKFYYP